uniref:C3H1-type domain-containing protein n=1 Tax=Alexandrium monilatum TaxID=311494 RepID=A0A7S4VH80_9DINO
MLRKALENVRRTAQAHMEAIKSAEAAFTQAASQLAQDQRALKQEAEALARERAELDEYRGGMPPDGEDQDQQPPQEEEVAAEPEGEDNAQQMQPEEAEETAFMEEEQPVEEVDDVQEDSEGNAGKGGRHFDRSRSRSRGAAARGKGFLPRPVPMAPPPAGSAAHVEATIGRLGLDDNAARAIKMFPPDQALNLLDQVGDSVRNPSAFVMRMCNRTMQDGGPPRAQEFDRREEGPPRIPTQFDRLEAAIADMGLDESATRVLHELPPEQALSLLSQVDAGVRNPSAFVMSLAHRALKGGPGPQHWQGPSLPELVEQNIARLRLDESATRMLHELSPEHAMDILDQIGDDVRNPSAFVTAEVRKVFQAGPPRFDAPRPPPPNSRDLSQQVANLAKALELDSDCLDALLSISTQEAVMILERLANTASNIRNRSAFVFAEVKKRKQVSVAQAPPPPVRHGGGGGTKAIPCKFWAEGRCKNGSECRFAHD